MPHISTNTIRTFFYFYFMHCLVFSKNAVVKCDVFPSSDKVDKFFLSGLTV
jgi:hypothetical protein